MTQHIINICGQCSGSGQRRRYEPVSRIDINPDSDFVRFVGWETCDFCGGDGLSPAGRMRLPVGELGARNDR